MVNGHLTEDDLVLHRYQESPDAAAVERHLAACEPCRTEYAALERVLGLLETAVPEPPPSYERDVWIGVQQRLAEPQSAWRQFGSWFGARLREPLAVHAIPATPPATWFRASWIVPQATLAAAIVALLVGGFAIDRVLHPQHQQQQLPSSAVPGVAELKVGPTGVTARDRVLIAAVGEHLQRSEMMLTEFNNADTLGSSIDLSAQQAEAEDLINENRLYRQSAVGGGQAQMASLLDDLERVLIEVAHAPASASPEELERMRTRLDTRDVLFKVRVAGAGLRAREDVAAVVAPSMSESGSGL